MSWFSSSRIASGCGLAFIWILAFSLNPNSLLVISPIIGSERSP
jgi:hypothetical protein